MDLEKLRKLIVLRAKIDASKEVLKKFEKDEEDLEREVSDMLVNAGVPSMTIDGRTVYLTTQYQVNKRAGIDAAAGVEILERLGLVDLIETAPQPARVKSWAVEQLKQAREAAANPMLPAEKALPADFNAAFAVFERQAVASRKK